MHATLFRPLAGFAIVVGVLLAAGIGWVSLAGAGPENSGPEIKVYKTQYCGCCSVWVDYLADEGFHVEAEDVSQADLNSIKMDAGLHWDIASCHTAFVDGYVIEGHVPAAEIRRLLEERPDVRGLSVPGMPIGSPGMEMGDRRDPYDVLTFDADGNTAVYASYHQH